MLKQSQSFSKYISNSSRVEWIDIVRGIMIILMVYGHNIQFGSGETILRQQLYFENWSFRFIYSFHMPCLMLLSGYFFGYTIKKRSLWRNRVKTIIIPTLVWSIIPVGLGIVRAVVKHELNSGVLINCLKSVVTYYWFLWAILFGSLLVWLIHKFCRDKVIVFIAVGIVLLFVPDWLNIRVWIYMYPYFTVGYLWNIRNEKRKWIDEHKGIMAAGLTAVFCVLFVFYNTDSFVYTTGIAVRNISQLIIDLYRYAIGFIGSAMIILFVYILYPVVEKRISGANKILAHCGRVSLTIYIIDSLLNSYVLPRVTKSFNLNYVITLAETVVVVGFCIIVDTVIKKIPMARKYLLGSR